MLKVSFYPIQLGLCYHTVVIIRRAGGIKHVIKAYEMDVALVERIPCGSPITFIVRRRTRRSVRTFHPEEVVIADGREERNAHSGHLAVHDFLKLCTVFMHVVAQTPSHYRNSRLADSLLHSRNRFLMEAPVRLT